MGEWLGWLPAAAGLVLGVVILAVVVIGAAVRARRTGRTLERFRSTLDTARSRLRIDRSPSP